MKQYTIKSEVSISGVGLHTGKAAQLTFKPAPVNYGCQFQRIDLEEQPIVKADVAYVVSTQRSTTIQNKTAEVHTVEHVLSALVGAGIDNVLIEINSSEVPIMDGSAKDFLAKLEEAGKEEQDLEKEYLIIETPLHFKDEATGATYMALPADDYQLTTMVDFNSPVVGQQYAALDVISDYRKEIAEARTFVFLHELEYLLNQNLIKGGDLDNAIVIVDRAMEQADLDALAKKLGKASVKVAQQGILNTTALRFTNEPARHKLLDVMGDLALVGKPIKGKIIATKPGHTGNVAFAKVLKQLYREQRKLKGKPYYDPTAAPLMDTMAIAGKLPHRYPFLLVDKIIELSDTHIVGVKNVTFNEQLFQGHFPGNPVFPGVLQLEAMAQTGGMLALSLVDKEGTSEWDTYFLKIDNVKFKNMVHPGDTMLLKMELSAPVRRGIIQMHGTAYVGNKIVSEGDLTAQVVKRQ